MKKKGLIGLISALSVAGVTAVASVGVAVANNNNQSTENPFYTITFETNGGDTIASTQIGSGQYLTGPTASRPGYEFGGWYTDAQCTKPFDFYATPISSNITLYAKWGVKYTVTFDSKGGSEIESVRVVEGNQLVEPTEQPTKSGYIFAGWCSDENCNTLYDFSQQINQDITLYAKWDQAYTVTFDTCGGELMTAQNVTSVSQITTETPTWGNYEFQGWYLDENYETALSSDYSITENITLYAKWPINVDDYYEFNKNTGKTYEITSYKQTGNEAITELYLPSSYKGLPVTGIGARSIRYCTYVNTIIIPNTVTSIGSEAFDGTYMTAINIPNSVTTIDDNVFYYCKSLTTITIPSSVSDMGAYVFSSCSSLTTIYVESESKPKGWNSNWNAGRDAHVLFYGTDWEYDADGNPVEIGE